MSLYVGIEGGGLSIVTLRSGPKRPLPPPAYNIYNTYASSVLIAADVRGFADYALDLHARLSALKGETVVEPLNLQRACIVVFNELEARITALEGVEVVAPVPQLDDTLGTAAYLGSQVKGFGQEAAELDNELAAISLRLDVLEAA